MTSIEDKIRNRLACTDEQLLSEALTKINNQQLKLTMYQKLFTAVVNDPALDNLDSEIVKELIHVANLTM